MAWSHSAIKRRLRPRREWRRGVMLGLFLLCSTILLLELGMCIAVLLH